MPLVIAADGSRLYEGASDMEVARWWINNGEPTDRLEDTGELMSDVVDILRGDLER